jgi:H+/Cl- antiporter ClcA
MLARAPALAPGLDGLPGTPDASGAGENIPPLLQMPLPSLIRHFAAALRRVALWLVMVLPIGVMAGSASAFFLWSLDQVTNARWENPAFLYLLPVAGLLIGWIYRTVGSTTDRGNDLIIDQIHQPGGGVPRRMAPLILLGTLVTHLFGGSAGREGTAVQMGGSLASAWARCFRSDPQTLRVLLMAGVAAGFGSVFGTPLAGAVFAMEVIVIGRMQYSGVLPILLASVVGDLTCSAWGVHHEIYHVDVPPAVGGAWLELAMFWKVALAGVAFGWVAWLFAAGTHGLQAGMKRGIPSLPLRAFTGGIAVVLLVHLLGTREFLGLGVSSPDPDAVTLFSAFEAGGAGPWSWWWKLVFTAITLAAGFKGGEVTPLFFIGATLGNVVAVLVGAPVDLFAALGFIAVFAGAAKTPLACTIMGIELFGAHHAPYFALACFVAHYASGNVGIYRSQKRAAPEPETVR